MDNSPPELPTKPHFEALEIEVEEDMENELTRLQLLTLTCTLGGLQVTWSTLNGNVNVFLTSIGISAAVSPLLWIIAPICGTFIQPLIGWASDRTDSRFGRRKPYILVGSIGTSVGLLGLFWTKYIAQALSGGNDPSTALITAVALVWVILTNVSVQPLQMGIRAFFTDGAPKSQQAQVNAWGNSALNIGNILGYTLTLTAASLSMNVRGFNHYNLIAIIASICLIITVVINMLFAIEPKVNPKKLGKTSPSLKQLFKKFRSLNLVSRRTRYIYQIQFCAWLGWFPFLFYMVSFVKSKQQRHQMTAQQSKDQPGALAAFLYAIVSGVGGVLIPQFLKKTKYADAAINPSSSGPTATIFGLPLEKMWCISQIMFAILMFCTAAAKTTTGAIIIIALGGIPWSLSNYIPYALIGVELAQQRALTHEIDVEDSTAVGTTDNDNTTPRYHDDETEPGQNPDDNLLPQEETPEERNDPFGAGATTGLHNAAISAPQIITMLISSGVLAATNKLQMGDGYGWVLRLSGVAALVAAWFTRKLFV